MNFPDFDQHRRLLDAWNAVGIARTVEYSLFTFGDSELPYYLVLEGAPAQPQVSITRGEVRVARPLIITPDTTTPEFRNFFENADE